MPCFFHNRIRCSKISDVLHMFEVFCNKRDGRTINAVRQMSRFGNLEDNSLKGLVSSTINDLPAVSFRRSNRVFFSMYSEILCFRTFIPVFLSSLTASFSIPVLFLSLSAATFSICYSFHSLPCC